MGRRGKGTNLVVVSQQLVKEVNGFVSDEALVLRVDKAVPRLLLETPEDVIVLSIKLNFILVEVVEEIIGSQDLGDLDQLIRIAVTVEERLLAENHRGKHGAQAPHVKAVVVLLEINQQLRSFEVSRRHTDIVLRARVVELGQTPVDETQLGQVSNLEDSRGSGWRRRADKPFGSHGRS